MPAVTCVPRVAHVCWVRDMPAGNLVNRTHRMVADMHPVPASTRCMVRAEDELHH